MNVAHMTRLYDVLADEGSLATSEFDYLRNYRFSMNVAYSHYTGRGCIIGLAALLAISEMGVENADVVSHLECRAADYLDVGMDVISNLGYPYDVKYGEVTRADAANVVKMMLDGYGPKTAWHYVMGDKKQHEDIDGHLYQPA